MKHFLLLLSLLFPLMGTSQALADVCNPKLSLRRINSHLIEFNGHGFPAQIKIYSRSGSSILGEVLPIDESLEIEGRQTMADLTLLRNGSVQIEFYSDANSWNETDYTTEVVCRRNSDIF